MGILTDREGKSLFSHNILVCACAAWCFLGGSVGSHSGVAVRTSYSSEIHAGQIRAPDAGWLGRQNMAVHVKMVTWKLTKS